MTSRRGLAALLATGVALAWTMQPPGMMQNSHYALVKAFDNGTARIDRTIGELGDLGTNDVATRDEHVYSVKAPGLAAAVLPGYAVVKAIGVRTTGDPQRVLWMLTLLGGVLPAFALLLLVAWAGNRLEPGYGVPAAVTLGLGTLILPFAPLLLSHVLSAAMLFGAFALLWRERGRTSQLPLVAAAGAIAGTAAVVEYSAVFGVVVLGAYAAARSRPLGRVLAYAGGALVGIAPLLLYNWWAFGSPVRLSYQLALRSRPELGDVATGARPSARVLVDLLFAQTGLVRLAPVLLLGIVGLVLASLRGAKAEALTAGAIAAVFLVYSSSYGPSFAGYGPGPRFAIPALPFLAFPLALSFRRFPIATTLLAVVSAANMTVIVATGTLGAYDGRWFSRLVDGELVGTAVSLVGITGWYAIVPLFAAAVVAGVLAAASVPRRARASVRPVPVTSE